MDSFREKAKAYRKSGDYENALTLYKIIIKDNDIENLDNWLGWEYADTLKKTGQLDSAIAVCKIIYNKDSNFKFIKDLLAWCLYEKYFKNNNNINIIKLEKIAEFITTIVQRDKDKTPYNKVVIRMINKFKKPFVAEKLIKWLEKVDLNYLSREPLKFNIKDRKVLEVASPLEEWYYLYCKALYNKEKYDECLLFKDKAFNDIGSFHNSYDIWLSRFEYLCFKNMGNINEAIDKINILLNKKELWIFYYDLAQIYILLNEKDKAIFYLSRALLFNVEDKSKVHVYETMGKILLDVRRYKESKMHLLYGNQIRIKENWKISDDIKKELEIVEKNCPDEVGTNNLKNNLINIWKNELLNGDSKRNIGEIITIGANKKYGFVKGENENYYFKRSSIISSNTINIGMKVSYKLKKAFNTKKNIESFEAIEILIMEDM